MRRLYPILKYALPALFVSSLFGSLVGTCVSGLVFEGTSCSVQGDIYRSLKTYGPLTLSVMAGLLVLTLIARRDYLRHGALQQFAMVKPAESLKPEDLDFEMTTPGGSVSLGRRPFYEAYVSRQATTVPPDGPTADRYDKAALAEELRSGRGFILLGQPLDGKSRTLYDILSRAAGWQILQPSLSKGMPDDEALSLVEDQDVILLLEDLHEYAGARIELSELRAAIVKHASSCVIASTCRDGPELKLVEQELRRLYEDVPHKLKLTAPTLDDKSTFARSLGEKWGPEAAENYPTLGFIAMERHMEAMSLRFRNLLGTRPDYADALRAMKLLTTVASSIPLSYRRIEAVLKEVFGRTDMRLDECFRSLADQAFLRELPSAKSAARPEPANLRDAVSYTEGKEPKDDFFPALLNALNEIGDADGMISLGVMSMISGNFNAQAVYDCFELATEADPQNASAWLNKASMLGAGEHYNDAVEAAERAIELQPDDHAYWWQRARLLHGAGRNEESRDAYVRAAELRPDRADTWRDLGWVYIDLGRYSDALRTFNRSIDLGADYDYARSWSGRAAALRGLGRFGQALMAYDRSIEVNPENFETWFNKSGLLRKLSRHEDALVAVSRAERLRPDHVEVHVAKCESLIELAQRGNNAAQWNEANDACDRALELEENHEVAWSMKGTILILTNRFEDALEVLERSISLRPERVEEWWHKGQALLKIAEAQQAQGLNLSYSAEYAAGMWWLCRTWHNRERLPDSGASVSAIFLQIDRDPTRCSDYCPSTTHPLKYIGTIPFCAVTKTPRRWHRSYSFTDYRVTASS